ncbi:golgin subfamily A member 6-like protein 22 isoform X2 [Plodia interpunctella]|uniref:golgin subfamily A member 6-like protein 22 isoform X2 n=1 Tax=Plodia interpunctella TaxID=58824 RepID=UPI002367A43B|nr:golgin subfamily A member 6-like protein 24 isoform X2 [Plodia interpunctella]
MFNFFKKKGKSETAIAKGAKLPAIVQTVARALSDDITTEESKNVNLREANIENRGVGGIFQIMAGKRKRNRKKRSESCRVSPQKAPSLHRSVSDVDSPTPTDENTPDSDIVKALVSQKYACKDKHVLLYANDPNLDEKKHAEALLREIAKSIDCTIDKINDQMGGTDSKERKEPVYETIDDNGIDVYKNELRDELDKLLIVENENKREDSPLAKKSNLKPPKSDTEGFSDDDRSECSKKRVTFRKHIVFDDGELQTDEEVDTSFESITSGEEEEEYLEDSIPDNDECLGGFIVSRNENKNVDECEELKRIVSENSDSGFIEGDGEKTVVTDESEASEGSEGSESESETEETIEEIIEEIVEEIDGEEVSIAEIINPEDPRHVDNSKTLVTQETKFQSQVAALTELADSRCGESERARQLIAEYRKEIEAKDLEIEQLKCELASAYKESELVRQRSRSLEEDLTAARGCSANLADKLYAHARTEETIRQLKSEIEDANNRRAELESRVLALERDKERLEQEKIVQEQKAEEALAAAEANTTKWRSAHEAARSQAAARAERMLADCEWKMRELEKKARDAEKEKRDLTETVDKLKSQPATPAQIAELQQLRGLATEQQRSVQSLTMQLQKVETREEALKLEVHRLKELLEKQSNIIKDKEDVHFKTIERLEKRHSEAVQTLKAEHATALKQTRAALERAGGARCADRKLREVSARFENLKETLATKEAQYERAITEAHSKADWDIMQLRHLLDKADITYANNMESTNQKFEKEKESLIAEWSEKLRVAEEEAAARAGEDARVLETTRAQLVAERTEQVNKLKEQHRKEMDEQWEQFMADKESCLERMKLECRQEGEEERIKREKELLEEIEELKTQVHTKSVDFDNLAVKWAACGRTLAVTEQELREALVREKELRERRSEDATKIKQVERASRDQIDHLSRKCSCLRKLFDDMRARLAAREQVAAQEAKVKEKEIVQLKAEVSRLTKILVEQSSPNIGARTRADGCEENLDDNLKTDAPRRKGGTVRTPEFPRKRTLPDLLLPAPPPTPIQIQNGRRRAKSVDLPAVQVPVRIKQLEEKTKD